MMESNQNVLEAELHDDCLWGHRENHLSSNDISVPGASEELSEQLDSTADMARLVHMCHDRVMEYERELEKRDNVIRQLQNMLGGTLHYISGAQQEEKSANDLFGALKTRISSAAELVGSIDLSMSEGVTSHAQDSHVTEEGERLAFHPCCDTDSSDLNQGADEEVKIKKRRLQCEHEELINRIRQMTLSGLQAMAECDSTSTESLFNECLEEQIRYIVNDAVKQRELSTVNKSELKSALDDKDAIRVTQLAREDELKELKSQVESLYRELEISKETAKTFEQILLTNQECAQNRDQEERTASRTSGGAVPQVAECTPSSSTETIERDCLNALSSGMLPASRNVVSQALEEDSKMVVSDDYSSLFARHRHGHSELRLAVIGLENAEELLVDLGTKARESVTAKKALNLMKEQHEDLKAKLSRAIDNCELQKELSKKAENIAANLQIDLETLLCKRKALDAGKTESDVASLGLEKLSVSSMVTDTDSQGMGEMEQSRLVPATDISDQVIYSLLSNISVNMGNVLGTLGQFSKSDKQCCEKMTSLKKSLERDIEELILYVTRKDKILRHKKSSVDAESHFLELKYQLEKLRKKETQSKDWAKQVIEDNESRAENMINFKSLYSELDSINAHVVKCLKYLFDEEFKNRVYQLEILHSLQMKEVKRNHTAEEMEIRAEWTAMSNTLQRKTDTMVREIRETCRGLDTTNKISGLLSSELGPMWNDTNDERKQRVTESLQEMLKLMTSDRIVQVAAACKDYYQEKLSQQVKMIQSVYDQDKQLIKSDIEKQKLIELLLIRKEISTTHQDNVIETIRTVEWELKKFMSSCHNLAVSTSMANADALDQLRKSIVEECENSFRAHSEIILQSLESQVTADKKKLDGSGSIGEQSTGFKVEDTNHFQEIIEKQMQIMMDFMQQLEVEKDKLCKKLKNIQQNKSLGGAKFEEDISLITGPEYYSAVMLAGDSTFINDVNTIKNELKAQYEKDMECLREYFEKKCADLEKRMSPHAPSTSEISDNERLDTSECDDDEASREKEAKQLANEFEEKMLKYKETLEATIHEVFVNLTLKLNDVLSKLKEKLQWMHEVEIHDFKIAIVEKIHHSKHQDTYCEDLKHLYEAELNRLRGNFEARLKENIKEAEDAIVKSLEEDILVRFGLRDLRTLRKRARRESEEVHQEPSDLTKNSTASNSELLNPVLLEHEVDMLKRGIDSDFNDRFSRSECMGRDILTLKLQVKQMEQSKNVLLSRFGEANVEVDDATSVTLLNSDLDKLLKDRDKWKKASQTLKKLLKDVLDFTHVCEDELNGTIVQSILRLSGANDEFSQSLSKENAGVDKQPRRVHFAPDILPNILQDDDLGEEEREEDVVSRLEESGEEIRLELRHCLARLRAEASAILGLSANLAHADEERLFNNNTHTQQELIDKISSLENCLKLETMEKDKLKVELHTAKGLCEGHAAVQASLQDRLTQTEAQLNALVAKKAQSDIEGYGEASTTPNHCGQPQTFSQLREKAQWVLKDYRQGGFQVGLPGTLVGQLIEELCNEGDRLSEEARKEKEDLQLQIEAADKQLRSTRAFLEEQAVEREQEREEFQKELDHLREVLGSRERGREKITKEEKPLLNEKEDQETDPASRATMESLEQQSNERSMLLEETIQKKEEVEAELKAAVDKIWELREIIRELEGQFEGSLLLEKELRSKNERLAAEFTLQGKKLNDLIEELESLRSSLGYSIPGEMENEGHTALLEKALRNHCLQVEQAKALGPSLKDLSKTIFKLGMRIDKKTKEIEALQVTLANCNNCSSPSEDVSIREQLEQKNWCMGSPAEDNMSDQGEGGSEEECDKNVSTPIPHVPIRELNLLEEKCNRHFQAQEPLLKKIHDLEMQIHSLRHNEEELTMEREVLQSQMAEQLLQASELQARLDEARRRGGRQIHCMTVTPLPSSPVSHSPIGSPSTTPDQPSFCCAGLADARHEINNLSQYLEKKELEVAQLKGALENSKKVVAHQENQLMNKAREEAHTFEKLGELQRLKSEMDELKEKLLDKNKIKSKEVPFPVLLDALLIEKNEEIDFLGSQVANLKAILSKTSNESKTPKSVQFSDESLEVRLISPSSRAGLSLSDDIEVIRDCVMREPSIEKAAIIHHDQEFNKGWLHSTKIEAKDLSGSPGLAVSPLTPYVRNVQELVNDPILEEESLDKSPSCNQSEISDPSKSGEGSILKEEQHSITKNEKTPIIVQDVEVQTTQMEDFEASLKMKEEEIEVLTKKVNEVTSVKNNLSTLVSELREKIDWHSRHLEKLEEESLGRDSKINEIEAENDSLQRAVQKLELEVEVLKESNSSLQNEISKKEEQVKHLSGKVDNYSQANKEQHMLLKATQQERKDILSMIDTLRNETRKTSECGIGSSTSVSSEKQSSSGTNDKDINQHKPPSPIQSKVSLRETIVQLVEEVRYVRNEIKNLTSQKEQLWQDLEKALKSKEDLEQKINNLKISSGNEGSDTWCQLPDQDERASSPSSVSLEQMMEKVQQEGIEILSLSEIAAGRRSTPCSGNHTFTATPLGSPVGEMMNASDQGLESSPVKSKSDAFSEEERIKLLTRIQVLENELGHKERQETRNRDWLEFIEKEGNAGWASFLETVGQNHRHKLEILKRLGEQRNARAQYEAEVASLKQQLSQSEAEEHKAVYRLGVQRSHVIWLKAALQQEKSNFSQLQVSLDNERKRADEAKQINSKVTKALQNELNQYQAKLSQLVESFNQEHNIRKNLEEQLKQLQEALRDRREAGEDQEMRNQLMANDERLKLKKMEEDCERKALEQELEDEKQKRIEYQQEILKLREILETRPAQEPVENARWCSTASTPYLGETSFNAEDTLQDLKGVNRILGCHVRQKYECANAIASSLESEKNYLEVKCCHLEQKVLALKDELARERSLWASEKANLLRDHQYLLESNEAIPQHASSIEIYRLQDSLRKLYSHLWRSERNRKALIWQKNYFLTLLSNYRIFKVETITELSKVTDEQRDVVDKITQVGNHSRGKSSSSQPSKRKRKNRKSFRVAVFTVIAISKMKVLVLRSLTGIRSGCRAILEDTLLPAHVHHSPNHSHVYQPLPYSSGSTRSSHYNVQPLSPSGFTRNPSRDMGHHHFS